MKIELGELRRLIREVAKTAIDAKGEGIALYIPVDEGDMTQAVLYKPNTLASILNSSIEGSIPLDEFSLLLSPYVRDSIVGAIRGESFDDVKEDVTFITRVASLHGYGPLLYDFMSTSRGWITPDPHKTSDAAMGVWKRYKEDGFKETGPIHDNPDNDFKVIVRGKSFSSLTKAHEDFTEKFVKGLRSVVSGTNDNGIYSAVLKLLDTISNEMLENSMP